MNSISISISIDFTFIHIHPHPLLTALIHESLTRLKIASRHCDSLSWACEREREGESCHCCCQARVVEARPICATTHTTLVSYFGVMSVGQRRREPAGMQGGGDRDSSIRRDWKSLSKICDALASPHECVVSFLPIYLAISLFQFFISPFFQLFVLLIFISLHSLLITRNFLVVFASRISLTKPFK